MSRGWILGATCALALASVRGHAGARTPLAVEAFELDNGLRVLVHENHRSPTVVVHVWYRVGAKDEEPGKTGFAHLFEHLMFKGSRHVPDGAFDRLLEEAGGWNNGTTNADRTNYFEQLPSNQLALALYLEADRMAGLWDAMSAEVLDNQRDVVKNERRQSYDNSPYATADLLVQRALWPPGHGNHHPTIGTMEDLDAASLADVERFYRTYYVPGNATLVVAGDVTVADARALVERYFGWMPRRPRPPHVTLTEPVRPLEGTRRLRTGDRVGTEKVILAWRSPPPFAPDDLELQVAAQLLAGSKTSRLHRRLLLDAPLAAQVWAYQAPQALGGQFEIHAIARPGVSGARLMQVIDEELRALAANGPDDDALVRARRMLEVELLDGLQGLANRADLIAEYDAYTGEPGFLPTHLRRLRGVTAAGVREAARRWLAADARVEMIVEPRDPAGSGASP